MYMYEYYTTEGQPYKFKTLEEATNKLIGCKVIKQFAVTNNYKIANKYNIINKL